MQGSLALESSRIQTSFSYSSTQLKANSDAIIVEQTIIQASQDKSSIKSFDLDKALQIKAQKIVDRLNEILQGELPDGLQSLKPQDTTPEATADRIVQGATAFFDVYAKQHPELSDEDLVTNFMETIRTGIQSGYDEAFGILEEIGAFDFEGVKEGIETTKSLIDQKLVKFESLVREKLGLPQNDIPDQISAPVTEQILKQGGVNLAERADYALSIAA
ncbi:MAG: DUF5610 domain-containing protein [Bdellovibrionales bacterium]|nr:DUF5610 domain-containing protein [Bdellovibrionales bacterium]